MVHDATRCTPKLHPESRHINGIASRVPLTRPAGPPGDGPDSDDSLAAVLIAMWSLTSGRTLRRDVRPDQLTEHELISFWADDMAPAPGRHATPPGEAR